MHGVDGAESSPHSIIFSSTEIARFRAPSMLKSAAGMLIVENAENSRPLRVKEIAYEFEKLATPGWEVDTFERRH